MKIIFVKDLKGHGKKDDIKEFKDGFATYLINNHYAVAYTIKSANILNNEKKLRDENEKALIEEKKVIKQQIEKKHLKFKVKTGNNDKVFGSVSSKQISEELKKNGFDIDKKKISYENELNTLGFHTIKINLYKNIEAIITIELVK